MLENLPISANLILAYSVFCLGAASPGPSNLAVMATAMNEGRKPALILALGVVSGSVFWGILAAFGLSAILATYTSALIAMKILGGFYLLWLASKSARSALSPISKPITNNTLSSTAYYKTYLRGATMHLTNPKAIFVWLSIVTLALPTSAKTNDAFPIVFGCTLLAIIIFCGYAILFSTPFARRIYQSMRRWFEGTIAFVFAYAGIRMLTSSR